MRRRGTLLLAALLLAAPLTGCLGLTGGGGDEATPTDAGQASGSGDGDARPGSSADGSTGVGNLTPLTFADAAGEATDATVWANGSFSPEQTCRLGGCQTGSAYQTVTLDDELPDGLPVRLTATLSYETGPTIFAEPLDLALFSEETSFYAFEDTEENGKDRIDSTLLGGSGPVTVQVFYRWPAGSEPEASYSLQIDIVADPATVPGGVPVAVDLAPGDRLQATPVAGDGQASDGGIEVGLNGPDDQRLAWGSADGGPASLGVPSTGAAGEHVLVVSENSAPVRLATNGSSATMRALETAFESGELTEAQPGETTEVTVDVAAPPLAVGAYLTESQPLGASATEGSITVTSPEGTLIEGEFGCSLCLTAGYFASAVSDSGVADLTAGTYTITYEPGVEAGYGVGPVVVTYER